MENLINKNNLLNLNIFTSYYSSRMPLYNLFSYNAEIQYKNCLLSKATLFTVVTAILYMVIPFFIAHRSKGFWLQSYYFYEQPSVRFSYDYLAVAETDDPSISIICEGTSASNIGIENEEYCVETQIHEEDLNYDGKNDLLQFKINMIIPENRTLVSILLILGIDIKLMNTCPLQMQSLVIINKDFSVPPSNLIYYGDLHLHQSSHLQCSHNVLDIKYNDSIFDHFSYTHKNIIDLIIADYLRRDVISEVTQTYSRAQNGHTGYMDFNFIIRIPEMHIRYKPSFLQELKWAWPQYLSLVVIFYYMFKRIKKFVFSNRLLMAWEEIPWKSRIK